MADSSPLDVIVQIAGEDVPAGRLYAHRGRNAESATFTYLDTYLARADAYELDPGLPLSSTPHQTPVALAMFGAFCDCSPDRWGRRLVQRAEHDRALADDDAERSFGEMDFLRRVRDDLRQGALRFRDPDSTVFLADEHAGVPALMDLGYLMQAAERLDRDEATHDDIRRLLRGGSSLGGARPKAHVLDANGRIAIAKFPSPSSDRWDVMRWEAVCLTLARRAGITVSDHALHVIDGKPVLVIDRFDRAGQTRIGYISAMTMLEARDNDTHSYLDIADAIQQHSPHATDDLHELWRRIAFTVLVSNTDDHLRNHGFLRERTDGWSLSPAFDINPNPEPGTKHLSAAIDFDDDLADIGRLMNVAGEFRLRRDEAVDMLSEVLAAQRDWRAAAAQTGLRDAQIDDMARAFEHDNTKRALEITAGHAQ